MPAPIVLPPHPFRGRVKHSSDELEVDTSRAASSLESGMLQYVATSFLSMASQYLTDVSATTIDSATGKVYMLRRTQPSLVILNDDGSLYRTRSDTNIVRGHSIKAFHGTNDSSSLWVVDLDAACIRVFDAEGNSLTIIGPEIGGSNNIESKDDSIGIPGSHGPVTFGKITDVAFDTTLGQVYVTDGDLGGPNNRVIVLNRSMQCVAVWGSPSEQTGTLKVEFDLPHAVLVDAVSRVWVLNSSDSRVVVLDSQGNYLAEINVSDQKPYGIALSTARTRDPTSATIYITGQSNSDPAQGVLSLYQIAMDGSNPSNIIRDPVINPHNQPLTTWSFPVGTLHSVTVGSAANVDLLLLSTFPTGTASSTIAYKLAAPRPQLKTQSSYKSPAWPSKFVATTLMHPFQIGYPIWVAEVAYDEALRSMVFDITDLTGNNMMLVFKSTDTGNRYWMRTQGIVYGPYSTDLIVPKADWLVSSTSCAGTLPILGVDCNWWSEMTSPNATNWHWFRSDSNVPWRTMNSTEDNGDKVPILGQFAFIYWPHFRAVATNDVGVTVSNFEQQDVEQQDPQVLGIMASDDDILSKTVSILSKAGVSSEDLKDVSTLIPGLSPGDGGLPLPVWPEQFFMTCTMTPVNASTPLSTEMTYDWPAKSQRTRMFNPIEAGQPQNVTDADLIDSTTWIFSRNADGTFKCGTKLPFGPTSPTWATAGSGKIMYTIRDNPQLSPDTVTRCFCAPIHEPGQFWIWYKTGDVPVVFCQTRPPAAEGTNLALADYSAFQVTDLVDPHTFDVPPPCAQAHGKLL
ncbi:hypothetical protein AUEXF2481DRAFT_27894 [Aureobasidium subglaciale EXF-2481]|uniref:Uncharacterized protein n=1 Tax=Aureobasidium subglaciale (strain EXF-2481) TaxID=1043005 RepID=A0A074YRN4_AURSE|nr:uncharacterized protein AUEXF2481DRAFT_27894 [Aureobasidium subglaciale EXF-2481]KAI5209251.1 hypothetical protein E4T38_02497 [Aureobasidium subglaciale]KAI5228158.1 hypothetical protein E4T40_02276 [Aureobasidium subglaciale]KAI5231388.1 hypothetical protein E4T41_02496 [Aureobasidium subglaciale]KAI5265544.1 hypothetical protein E4T46_02274 [Aureobasidium subglaciale]KEQ96757.1 hypothetical protein AUEXF2481DRAFT_27894 [Aureobasidium subglaciale EXF-2481]